MQGYTIAETFTLPSKGKIYTENVNPVVKLRSMTTEEEMKRLTRSDTPYKVMCEIIDDCMVEKIGISSYDMCLGDYQFLLHRLRMVTYGSQYKLSNNCRWCKSQTTETINLEDLRVIEYDEGIEKYAELDLPVSKKHITLRMQTPRMLDDIALKTKDFKRKTTSMDPAFLFTVQSLIDTVNGEKLDVIKLEQFARKLPLQDANYIIKYGQKLNDSIGIDTEFDIECSVCGLEYHSSFRFTPEFFGPSIDI
jgi:hypothetical protein